MLASRAFEPVAALDQEKAEHLLISHEWIPALDRLWVGGEPQALPLGSIARFEMRLGGSEMGRGAALTAINIAARARRRSRRPRRTGTRIPR
jgi:hypothetical protein